MISLLLYKDYFLIITFIIVGFLFNNMSSESSNEANALFYSFLLTLKYEVYANKELFIDKYNSNRNKLTIPFLDLEAGVQFLRDNRDICKEVNNMRIQRSGNKILALAGIEFSKDTRNQLIYVSFNTMVNYMSIKGVVRAPRSYTISRRKEPYSSSHIRHEYTELQLQECEANIAEILSSVNEQKRYQLLTSFCSKIMKANSDDSVACSSVNDESKSVKDAYIVDNIRRFLDDLQGTSKGSIPEQHLLAKRSIVTAAIYGYDPAGTLPTGVSINSLSEHLGVTRPFIEGVIDKILTPPIDPVSHTLAETEFSDGNQNADLSTDNNNNNNNSDDNNDGINDSDSDEDSDYEYETDSDVSDDSVEAVPARNDYSRIVHYMDGIFRLRDKRSDTLERS